MKSLTTYKTRNSTYTVEQTDEGFRVMREGQESPFPHALAETGVWKDLVSLTNGPRGVVIIQTTEGTVITSTVEETDEGRA